MLETIENFLNDDTLSVNLVENERALQLELGLFLRQNGYTVQFEKTCKVDAHEHQTKRQKRYLDLLVGEQPNAFAIELKVPLASRVPETKYDFISDIAFIEAVIKSNIAKHGLSLMVTNDPSFWSGKATGIYTAFRSNGSLNGLYQKPTGSASSKVFLENHYALEWKPLRNTKLMKNAKYLMVSSS